MSFPESLILPLAVPASGGTILREEGVRKLQREGGKRECSLERGDLLTGIVDPIDAHRWLTVVANFPSDIMGVTATWLVEEGGGEVSELLVLVA